MEATYVVRAVRRHKLLVAATILITLAAAGAGLWLAPKTYEATATLSVAASPRTSASSEDLDALRGSIGELANSQGVLQEVAERLPVHRSVDELRDSIKGQWVTGTVLVQIQVTDHDPRVAAIIANTVADVVPMFDVSNATLLFTTSNPARPPTAASSPDLLLGIGVAALLAVLLAVGAALLRERRTAGLHDATDVEQVVQAPVLATVARPRDPTNLPALYPGTAAADVFRRLRIALEAEASADPVSLVVVAGLTEEDVDVWLGANLAISLATGHRRVLLVDGRLGDHGGSPISAPGTEGLYDVLTGAPLDDALVSGPVDGLTVLPAGEWGGIAPEHLLETGFADAMVEATRRFDVVVVLAPSLAACEDARIMAAGGSLLLSVPESGLSQHELRRHAARVRNVGVRLLGVVMISRRVERVPARA